MKPVPAIVEPARIDLDMIRKQLRLELAGERDDVRIAERNESERDRHAAAALAARESARKRRLRIGAVLAKARVAWPERGPKAKGWGEFLREFGISEDSALRYMAEARGDIPQKQTAAGNESDDDESDVGSATASDTESSGDRDSWCTPDWLVAMLPLVDLDPCSNPHSSIRAHLTYSLEGGRDGLVLPWQGLVYVNGPYSKLLPWAEKLDSEGAVTGAGFLVNADNSPAWWHVLLRRMTLRLDFNERLEFKPPPGVKASKNDRPQTLLMDEPFWAACNQAGLLEHGTLWRVVRSLHIVR